MTHLAAGPAAAACGPTSSWQSSSSWRPSSWPPSSWGPSSLPSSFWPPYVLLTSVVGDCLADCRAGTEARQVVRRRNKTTLVTNISKAARRVPHRAVAPSRSSSISYSYEQQSAPTLIKFRSSIILRIMENNASTIRSQQLENHPSNRLAGRTDTRFRTAAKISLARMPTVPPDDAPTVPCTAPRRPPARADPRRCRQVHVHPCCAVAESPWRAQVNNKQRCPGRRGPRLSHGDDACAAYSARVENRLPVVRCVP